MWSTQSRDMMRGDGRIPHSVQHNVATVEKLDGVIFFRVSITASRTLRVTLIVRSSVNQNQPVLGARRSSGMKRKLLMEIKVLDCPKGSPFQTVLMWSSDRLRDEQGRVVHIWFKGCFCHESCQRSSHAFIGPLVYFHLLTCTEHPLKVNKSLIFFYFKTWPTERVEPVIYWRLSLELHIKKVFSSPPLVFKTWNPLQVATNSRWSVQLFSSRRYRKWGYCGCVRRGRLPSFGKRRATEKSVTKEEKDSWGLSCRVQAVV